MLAFDTCTQSLHFSFLINKVSDVPTEYWKICTQSALTFRSLLTILRSIRVHRVGLTSSFLGTRFASISRLMTNSSSRSRMTRSPPLPSPMVRDSTGDDSLPALASHMNGFSVLAETCGGRGVHEGSIGRGNL